mgnify:CR=1 FL=1
MGCPSIQGLTLDSDSQKAIDQIRHKADLANFLGGATSFGVLVNIFNTRQPTLMSYNIYQTDFQSFARAISAVPLIYRKSIALIASQQELRNIDYKQRTFWKAVRQGCKL